jgi:nifR3 family TIM-barrel protein
MVASRELARERPDMLRRTEGRGTVSPHVVQLAGCEPEWMAEGARVACALGADVIDINMGCPAREVTGKLSGSALMRDLDHALTLIEAVVRAADVPVTLKMRLGWDHASLNAPELAARAEQAGVQLVSVHGRTRCQFFKGRADWSSIGAVKARVSIPVLANGDVGTVADARTILEQSGADGLMIGRGAYGAPWLPGRIALALETGDPGEPSLAEQRAIATAHFESMLEHYGMDLGARNARKHLGWYVARAAVDEAQAKSWRARLCTEDHAPRVSRLLAMFYDAMEEAAA